MTDPCDANQYSNKATYAAGARGGAEDSGENFLRGSYTDVRAYFNLNYEDKKQNIELSIRRQSARESDVFRKAVADYRLFLEGTGRFNESVRDLLSPIMREDAARYFEMQLMQDIERDTGHPHSGRRIKVNGQSKLALD